MRLFALSLVLALAMSAGCIRSGAFACTQNTECMRSGVQGTCEPVGFCSFPDSSCGDGRRFGDLSGSYANQCIGGDVDAGADSMPGDGSTDAASAACPSSYAPLSGANHVYRKITTPASWQNQRSACTADSASAYLAIPADAAELQALVTLAGANAWVGIDDLASVGTYVDVKGATPTFLPWAVGEPINAGNKRCVEVLVANTMLAVIQCGNSLTAVCECVPP